MREANLVASSGVTRAFALGAVLAMLLVVALALGPDTALAAPQLEVAGSCEPGGVRPGPALITCTVDITNSGDETATSVRTSLGPSDNCNLTNPTIPPLIYLYVDGVLQDDASLPLSLQLGDLGAGEAVEVVTQIAVRNLAAGQVGAELGVSAQGVARVETDLCWTTDPSAADPPAGVSVAKTLVSPAPGGGTGFNPVATYEIAITNTGPQDVTSLTLIDIISSGLELVAANPAVNGSDALGRPTWDLSAFGLSSLAPGAEARVTVTLGSPDDGCTNADNLAVVQATVGGAQQDHVAFVDRTARIGDCSQPEYCLHWSPDENDAIPAPCDEPVCWSLTPGSDFYQPAFDCEEAHCWFYPPGFGIPALRPCTEQVCWINFGSTDFEFYLDVPCDLVFCEYAAPDGSDSVQSSCDDFGICWTSPPEGGRWEPVYGCGDFGVECWYSPPGEGRSFLYSCGEELCFATPPPGAVTFYESYPIGCDEPVPLCWPASPIAGEFYTYPVGCSEVSDYCVGTPPSEGIDFIVPCGEEFCWGEWPEDIPIPPGIILPPGQLVPLLCQPGETGKTATIPAVSVELEVVEGISTPAEIVEGTVETVEPTPSASSEPATLEPSSRVEELGGPPPPPQDNDPVIPPIDTSSPPGGDDDAPDTIQDVLDLTKPPPANIGAPDSGYGYVDGDGSSNAWLGIAGMFGVLAGTCLGAAAVRRRV